jgi:hypothetical protein
MMCVTNSAYLTSQETESMGISHHPPEGCLSHLPVQGNFKRPFIEGYATDIGSGVDKARFIAYYENTWHVIGGEYSTLTFSYNWDMCDEAVPDGPVSLALQIWDNEGNPANGLPGLAHITKDFDCSPPPPVCSPGDNQVALFTSPDYLGSCALFGIGNYPDPSAMAGLGDNDIESILVGKNVLATLFSDASFSGRGDTYIKSDSNIDGDLVGSNQVSSFFVISKTVLLLYRLGYYFRRMEPRSLEVHPQRANAIPVGQRVSRRSWLAHLVRRHLPG